MIYRVERAQVENEIAKKSHTIPFPATIYGLPWDVSIGNPALPTDFKMNIKKKKVKECYRT